VLEGSLKTTEGSSGGWEIFAWVCSVVVAIGVAAEIVGIVWEYRDDLNDWRRGVIRPPHRPSFKRFFWFEVLATVLVVAGVFGEAWASKELASINSQLRSKTSELRADSDQLLALVTQEAGSAAKSAQIAGEMEEALSLDVAQSNLVLAAQASRQRFTLFAFNRLGTFRRANIELAVNNGSDPETKWFAQELTKGFQRFGWKVSTLKSCASNDRPFNGTTIFNKWVTTGGARSSDPSSSAMLASFQAASKEGMTMKDAWRINELSWAIDAAWEKAPDLDDNTFCIEVAEAPERWR
jgi:hypothetical protein